MNRDHGKEEIWMLAFEIKSLSYQHNNRGVFTEPSYGYFASEEEATEQIGNTRDGKKYFPHRISLGGVTPLIQNVSTEPLDLNRMSSKTLYAKKHYASILQDEETLKTFAQFVLPNREAEALKFICDYAHRSGDTFFNTRGEEDILYYNLDRWVTSEVAKILTGDNYEAFTKHSESNWGDFDYSDYAISTYPLPRNLELDYDEYVLPNSGLSALVTMSKLNDFGNYSKEFLIDQATRILTGKKYGKLVFDSGIEWEIGWYAG